LETKETTLNTYEIIALVQFFLNQQLPQTSILSIPFLQTLRRVGTNSTVLFTPAIAVAHLEWTPELRF
jgi:hypothetical protein